MKGVPYTPDFLSLPIYVLPVVFCHVPGCRLTDSEVLAVGQWREG